MGKNSHGLEIKNHGKAFSVMSAFHPCAPLPSFSTIFCVTHSFLLISRNSSYVKGMSCGYCVLLKFPNICTNNYEYVCPLPLSLVFYTKSSIFTILYLPFA